MAWQTCVEIPVCLMGALQSSNCDSELRDSSQFLGTLSHLICRNPIGSVESSILYRIQSWKSRAGETLFLLIVWLKSITLYWEN